MIIDAMDILYTGRVDGFCIVSSDSDFARLAARIREQGVTVYGFGEKKTPRPFVTACDRFVYVEVLRAPEESAAPESRRKSPDALRRDHHLLALLRAALDAVSDEDGWAHLGAVGSHIAKQSPEFDSRNYGFARLSDLVEATGAFVVDRTRAPQKGIMVRAKS